MTVIEYFGIDEVSITALDTFFNERSLTYSLVENKFKFFYGNPMPYIKIVSLGDDFIEFQAPMAIVVLECLDSKEYTNIDRDININDKLSNIFGSDTFVIIPVYGKEVDIKVIAKNDYAMGIPSYKRIGMNADSHLDPTGTIQINTYKSPSYLMLL
jgi:hypothetical protein